MASHARTLALLSLLVLLTACGNLLGNLMGGQSTSVGALWPDVPTFESAKKADMDLPLPVKLMVQAYIKSVSDDAGSLDYVVYTTPKTPAEVTAFYTPQRMAALGWNSEDNPGQCTAADGGGAICGFGRHDGAKESILMLVVTADDSTKQTQLFYVRMSVTGTPTP